MKKLLTLLFVVVLSGCAGYGQRPVVHAQRPIIQDRFECTLIVNGDLLCIDRMRYNIWTVRRGHQTYSYWFNYRWDLNRRPIQTRRPSARVPNTPRPRFKVPPRSDPRPVVTPRRDRVRPRITPPRRATPRVQRRDPPRRPVVRKPQRRRINPPRRGGDDRRRGGGGS